MPRWVAVSLFLTIFSSFLYLANLVVYEAIALAFSASGDGLVIVGVTLGILSTSFLLATILGMRYYNLFTRWYYAVSAIWMGILTYLFFASVAYGAVSPILGDSTPLYGIFFLGLALSVSGYGFLNARKIVVTRVDVRVPGLPEEWKGRTAIWVSDLHLGQLHGSRFAGRVVEEIRTLPHDVIFIGGDLFDGTGAPDIHALLAPLKELSAPLGTFFITGNHEEFGSSERFLSAVRAAGMRTLVNELVAIDGLQIIGVDYAEASNRDRFRELLWQLPIDKSKPSILLKHEPKDLDVAQEAGISLQISGHTHRAQLWPLEYVARFVYKGYSYGLKPLKNMQVLVSSGVGTWGPPMRVGNNSEIVSISFQ